MDYANTNFVAYLFRIFLMIKFLMIWVYVCRVSIRSEFMSWFLTGWTHYKTLTNFQNLFLFVCLRGSNFVCHHGWRFIFPSWFEIFSFLSFIWYFAPKWSWLCLQTKNILQIKKARTSQTEVLTGTDVMAQLLRDFIPGSAQLLRAWRVWWTEKTPTENRLEYFTMQ